MSKIVLNDVTNLSSLSVINDNFDKIEQELQNKVLYRDNPEGEPNTVENDVDFNGNDIYNVYNLSVSNSFTVNGKNVEEVVDDAIAGVEQSAESAANSATAAAASAASAAASATTATTQAGIATTKASEASASADNASASSSEAAFSVVSAASSATSASNSAATAATQASNAANAAAASLTSSNNSATSAGLSNFYAIQASNSNIAAGASATASAASASSAAASAASAAALLDNFDDRYLGSKSTAPTLDNDGNALISGALYFNDGTVVGDDKGMWAYDGGSWIKASSASQAILVTYEYLATQGQATFSGADANGVTLSYTVGSVLVAVNGVRMRPGNDYTASNGTSIVLSVPATAGDDVVIDAFSTFDVANTYTQGQVDAAIASTVKLADAQTITGVKTFSAAPVLGTSQLGIPSGSAPSYTCRAWVNFNGTGTVAIRASGNVSSITDNGLSDYTANFTTAMVDANFSVVATGNYQINSAGNSYTFLVLNGTTASSARVTTVAPSTDQAQVCLAIFR